ncbi:hypothetical protein KMW28_05485 [Flammeovirga yaeyamensis]|uniref:PpiC domain-containing protein n=1 Tax=Flammeovirga yaeyamensis TaxID=367791 RepID=A0AAX1N6E9_9BACT|nr:hypothetical protein [Flammeovirga yaeyamensis]MBB3697617.1 hypothetical protein [Flammeovirga yaeyamensis]NMF36307.1 hypothetical protein [Flammeovirga yaeyamensis]QWG03034.1 hypothetical protein KMW28_05485 [Flammeovirga yaeyamensis]
MFRSLFLVLIFFSFWGNTAIQNNSYIEYHQRIDLAENLISTERFDESLQVYIKLFDDYKFVFLRDYKVASQVALKCNKKELAFVFIKNAISNGWSKKSLKKNIYLKVLQSDDRWSELMKEYDVLRSNYSNKLNLAMREEVHQMFKKDQKKAFGAFIKLGNKAQEKYIKNKFVPHSETQMKVLRKMLEKEGYPGEKLIGNNYWMSTIVSHHNSMSKEYNQKDTLFKSLKPQLFQALDRGEISPYEIALMEDWYLTVTSSGSAVGYGFLNSPKKSTLDQTNKLRQTLGLRSVELRNKLVDIEEKTGMNFYLPDWVNGKISIK